MRRIFPGLILLSFCGPLFFIGLGDRELTSSHEARAAQNAQSILDDGDWLMPRLLDQHVELQKPPLYYWLVAILGWLRGGVVDAWAVRLPAALAALGCVCWLYFLGIRSGRPRAGFLAALILASFVHFTWLARVGRIDMPLTSTITLALGGVYLAMVGERPRLWLVVVYASLGFGLLLKGPIAAVLPALVVGSAFGVARFQTQSFVLSTQYSVLAKSLWWGIPVMLAIAAPWYVWANWRTDNQLWEVFFWYHNVERGLGSAEALAAHPWWFYGPRAFVDLLPWSLAIPVAVYVLARSPAARQDRVGVLGLIWFGSILVFLSCMRFKRADYLLPAYPGVAIFLGAWLERWTMSGSGESTFAWRRRMITGFAGVLLAVWCGWLVYHVQFASDERSYRAMADEIRRHTKGPVVFFRAESHLLAHHVGQPVRTILEWENLDIWARKNRSVYFVMPETCAHEWRDHLPAGALEEVLRSADFVPGGEHRPLVVMRNVPQKHAER